MCRPVLTAFLLAFVLLLTSTHNDGKMSRKGFIFAARADAVEEREQRVSRACLHGSIDSSGSCVDASAGQATTTANEASPSCLQRECTEDDRTAASSLFENIKADESSVLQLVRPSDSHDTLMVEMEALDALERIKEPVAFVSVAGPYHG